MNRFNIFNRPRDNVEANPYDDRAPLSPRAAAMATTTTTNNNNNLADADLEAQHPTPRTEMTERTTPHTRFLPRFRPPSNLIPGFLGGGNRHSQQQQQQQQPPPLPGGTYHPSTPSMFGYRPASSFYSDSGAGLRGPPATTVLGAGPSRFNPRQGDPEEDEEEYYDEDEDEHQEEVLSPKSPDFRIRADELRLPGTRLHVPGLGGRPWTRGSNGPPTRPGTGVPEPQAVEDDVVVEPAPAVVRARRGHGHGAGSEHRERRKRQRSGRHGHGHRHRHRRDRSGSGSGSGSGSNSERSRSGRSRRSGRSGSHGSEDREERSARRREREGRRQREGSGSSGSRSSRSSRGGPPPKHFLFCFPWVQSRRARSYILRSFVSGLFLVSALAVYLALSVTQNMPSTEFIIVLVLIILAVTVFFCHSLIRLCMLVVKARKREQDTLQGRLPETASPGGYAIPRQPIPVVLARDEEAAGIESEATKTGPPAYGLWRESVRVDPNRLYWMRNEHAPAEEVSDISSSSGVSSAESLPGARGNVPRPPSYSSDDGVSYVVDARPRTMAPAANAHHTGGSQISGSWV